MKQVIRTLTLLWSLALTVGDTSVTCVISEDCLLPCSSSLHDIIHWVKDPLAVHSFYRKKDQLEHQSEEYAKRTSLFPELIPNGNISLLLKQVKIKDGGRYKCYTADHSNNKEMYVMLSVEAPIKQVDINLTSDGLVCRTDAVYPKPDISWFIDFTQQKLFKVETPETEQGLFSLITTFKLPQIKMNVTYSCSISISDPKKSYRASLTKDEVEIYSGQDVVIHCPVSQSDDGNYVIRLSFGESSSILLYTNQGSQTTHKKTQWNGINVELTHEGTITLHTMEVDKHNGTYICERKTSMSREFVWTTVQIRPESRTHAIVASVVCVVCFVFILIIVVYCIKKRTDNNYTPTANGNGS